MQVYLKQTAAAPAYGPFTPEQVESLGRTGKLHADHLVSVNQETWHRLDEVKQFAHLFELAGATPSSQAATATPSPVAQAGAATPADSALPPRSFWQSAQPSDLSAVDSGNELNDLAAVISSFQQEGHAAAYASGLGLRVPEVAGHGGPSQMGLARGGLICSLLGIVTFFGAVAGVILSAVAISKMRQVQNYEGRNLASYGVTVGIVVIVVWLLALFVYLATVGGQLPNRLG